MCIRDRPTIDLFMDDLYPDYYKFVFVGIPDDIVLSELYQLGFESFEEKGNSLEGYVPANLVNESWKNLSLIHI